MTSAHGPGAVPAAVAALRRGREALEDIEEELDSLLVWIADPSQALDVRTPDRLAGAAREAGEALASLGGASLLC